MEKKLLNKKKEERRSKIHSLHKYYGKLIPAIPAFAIELYAKKDDVVLDPFCGSGTTLVEAQKSGCSAIGIDLDPLATLISKSKTSIIPDVNLVNEKKRLLNRIEKNKNKIRNSKPPKFENSDIDYWFDKNTQLKLSYIRGEIMKIIDTKLREFFLVCFSSIVRKVSLADPNQIKPCKTYYYKEKRKERDVFEVFKIELEKKVRMKIGFNEEIRLGRHSISSAKIYNQDSRKFPEGIKNVDLVVTNPPYMASVDYVRANKLEGWWAGVLNDYSSLAKNVLSTERVSKEKIDKLSLTGYKNIDLKIKELFNKNKRKAFLAYKFFFDMEGIMREIHRVLKKRGKLVIKMSESRYGGVMFHTPKYLMQMGDKVGFRTINSFSDKLESHSLNPKRNHTASLITHDKILILEKE